MPDPRERPPLLAAEGIRVDFDGLRALDGVDLSVDGRGIVSVIGPNGAGKTTFFNVLSGFIAPTAGRVLFRGREITNLPPERISRLGIARSFQITSIFPGLSVLENVRVAVQSRAVSGRNFWTDASRLEGVAEKARRVLSRVGLAAEAGAPASALGYGQQRALDLAVSLATDPELLLLDEPTSGMSREDASSIIALVRELAQEVPVVLIEHNIDAVLSVSDRILVLHFGRVLAEGTPREIRENAAVQEAYLGVF